MDDCNSTVSITLTPPGMDKISFLSKGAGQNFLWEDVPAKSMEQADLFHFGYPTAMDLLFAREGAEFFKMFSKAKETGVTTSVDMTLPDLESKAGKLHWLGILQKTLPFVDIFMPSIEETLFMLDRDKYIHFVQDIGEDNMIDHIDPNTISDIGDTLLAMGPKIVVVKMGKQGLYLRTAPKEEFISFGRALSANSDRWFNRELWDPAFHTDPIRSTTGAGDTAIAGFLASFLRGDPPEIALEIASISASLCIGSYDTVSRIGKLSELDDFLEQELPKLTVRLNSEIWQRHISDPVYSSIRDEKSKRWN
jgi:sugar/nucleoside kinase (ribokinase family)